MLESCWRSHGQSAATAAKLCLQLSDWGSCAAGDWLQGPYVYALYQHYGYQVHDIGRLFIAGFGSSMVFGTVAGSLADKQCVPSSQALATEAVVSDR